MDCIGELLSKPRRRRRVVACLAALCPEHMACAGARSQPASQPALIELCQCHLAWRKPWCAQFDCLDPAGDTLKISLTTGSALSYLAWSLLDFPDAYQEVSEKSASPISFAALAQAACSASSPALCSVCLVKRVGTEQVLSR